MPTPPSALPGARWSLANGRHQQPHDLLGQHLESEGLRIRLAATDAAIGTAVAGACRELLPGLEVTFDPDPAPIMGGAWISTADGRRFVAADWRNRAREAAAELAERLLPLL